MTARATVAVIALAAVAGPARAAEPVASTDQLPTGNGFGLMVFDATANALTGFLERPYRFLRASPGAPDGDGVVRRDLAFDAYFGLRSGATSVWLGTLAPSEVGYLDQSNVIRSVVTVGELTTESFYVAPFGLAANGLIMFLRVTNTGARARAVTAFALQNFKLGAAPDPDRPGDGSEAIAFDAALAQARETGPGGGTMLYAALGGLDASSCATGVWQAVLDGAALATTPSCAGADRVNVMQRELGAIPAGASRTWAVALLLTGESGATATTALRARLDAFVAGRAPDALLAGILAEWQAWRGPAPALTGDALATWRQSEAVLRMAQILEPYGEAPRQKQHGMLLASLPPGPWHVAWVRDMTYAIVALARSGHHAEARRALDFFLDADAGKYADELGGVPYRVSAVRYFGDGEEEADYSGQPTRNLELDGWGLVMWAARQYVEASGDVGWLDATTRKGDTVYQALRGGVAEALAANLEASGVVRADASIWEVHWGNRQHFLYTTAAAARGFCDMAALARRVGDAADRDRYAALGASVNAALRDQFVDDHGVLAGSLEKLASGQDYRDGATVEAFTWDLIAPDDPIMAATMAELAALQTPLDGFRRVEGSTDPYDTDEWIFVDLRASEAFHRLGDSTRADALLDWVTAQAAANHHLVPELYNSDAGRGELGRYAGAVPMVGYGAGLYLLTQLHRAGELEPRDCGTRDPGRGDAGPEQDAGPSADDGGDAGCGCTSGRGGGPELGALVLLAAWAGSLSRRAMRVGRA